MQTTKMKKPPLRKCVGCRNSFDKSQLIRVVRGEDGTLVIDTAHRMNGRGAYLCNNPSCLELAKKAHGLERSLKGEGARGAYEAIRAAQGEKDV